MVFPNPGNNSSDSATLNGLEHRNKERERYNNPLQLQAAAKAILQKLLIFQYFVIMLTLTVQ